MKNLRKAFALVLVIAMAFSLVTIASAAKLADYSDAASVTQKEAVDVLTQAGVLAGANGAFSPTDNFTREQAAKVIVYLMLGAKVADKLPATTTSFSDVASTRWSAPFIQYGVTAGVFNGMGDGTFNPEGKVTGTQFAKMLLTALGYGKNGEYVGPSWEYNTMRDAVAYEILDLDVDYTSPATREQVAKYALNALTMSAVVWDKTTDEYVIKNLNSTNYFATKLGLTYEDNAMSSGMSGHKWYLNGNSIGFFADEKLIATDATGLQINQMTDKYGTWAMFFKAELDTAEGVRFYHNGVRIADFSTTASYVVGNLYVKNNDVYEVTGAGVGNAATAAVYAVRGAVVNFVNTDKDSKAETVSIIEKYVVIATGAPSVSFGSVKIPGVTFDNSATTINEAKVKYPADIAADDYLLVYKDLGSGIYYVEKAQIVTGVATSSSSTFGVWSYNIGGTARKSCQLAGSVDGDTPGDLNNMMATLFNVDLDVVVDNGGNIIDVSASTNSASTAKYAVVLDTAAQNQNFAASAVQALLLFTDGTTGIVTLGKVGTASATLANAGALENQFVTYTVTDSGKYNIKDATYGAHVNGPIAIARKAAFVTGYVGDSETIFITPNTTTVNDTDDWSVIKGIANAPATSTAQNAVLATNIDIVKFTSSGTAKFVFIGNAGTPAAPLAQNVAYIIYDGLFVNYTVFPAKDGEPAYYEYKAIVNGQATTLKSTVLFFDMNAVPYPVADVGLKAVTYDEDGYVTSYGDADGAAVGIGTAKASNGIVKLGGIAYTYNDSTKVFFIDTFGGVTVKAATDIVRDTDDVVTSYLTTSTTDAADLLSAIYITVK